MTYTAYIHPTLLLSLSDHYNRVTVSSSPKLRSQAVFGIVLGKKVNDTISILNGFEYPYDSLNNAERFAEQVRLLGEVYGSGYLDLVGFYIIDSAECDCKNKPTVDTLKGMIPQLKIAHISCKSLTTEATVDELVLVQMGDLKNYIDSDPVGLQSLLKITSISSGSNIPYEVRTMKAESLVNATYTAAPKLIFSEGCSGVGVVKPMGGNSRQLQDAMQIYHSVENGDLTIIDSPQKQKVYDSISGYIKKNKSEKAEGTSTESVSSIDKEVALSSLCASLFRDNLSKAL